MTNEVTKPMEIREWAIQHDHAGRLRVWGKVFNNPKFVDGSDIMTSPVTSITFADPDHVAITKNSAYLLK